MIAAIFILVIILPLNYLFWLAYKEREALLAKIKELEAYNTTTEELFDEIVEDISRLNEESAENFQRTSMLFDIMKRELKLNEELKN